MTIGTYQTITIPYGHNTAYLTDPKRRERLARGIEHSIKQVFNEYATRESEGLVVNTWGPDEGMANYIVEVDNGYADEENMEIHYKLYVKVQVYTRPGWDEEMWRRWLRTAMNVNAPHRMQLSMLPEHYHFWD